MDGFLPVVNALLLLLIGLVLWRMRDARNNTSTSKLAPPKTETKEEEKMKDEEKNHKHKGDAKDVLVEDGEVITEEELISRKRTAKLLAQRLDKAKELWERMERLANAPKTKLRDSHQTLRRLYDSWYSETSFLDRIKAPFTPNTFCQLHSSNLIHIEAVLSVLEHPNVSDICDVHSRIRFLFPSSSTSSSSSPPSSATDSSDGSDSEAASSEHESSDPESREADESYEDEDDDEVQQQDVSKIKSTRAARQLGDICRETQNAIQQNPLIEQVRKRRVSRKVMKESQIKRHQLIVDVVCKAGTCWICIIARNPAQLLWEASDDNSRRGLRQKIEKICRGASNQMQHPEIVVALPHDTPMDLQMQMMDEFDAVPCWREISDQAQNDSSVLDHDLHNDDELGDSFEVKYRPLFYLIRLPPSPTPAGSLLPFPIHVDPNYEYINFDVSTLVALASDMCNGASDSYLAHGCTNTMKRHGEGAMKFLKLQAEEENLEPVIPLVREFVRGKIVAITARAREHFVRIIGLIGTLTEKERAQRLLKGIRVLEDLNGGKELPISPRVLALRNSKTVGQLQRNVFGVADSIPSAITTTSNLGFVRAASHEGVHLRVFFHGSRALLTNKHDFPEKVVSPSSDFFDTL